MVILEMMIIDQGVLGNRGDINFNGQLVRNFVSNNDLTLINSIESLCTGIFSRTANGSSTLLDLAMADMETMDRIISLEVDETNFIFKGSDHSALLLEIGLGSRKSASTSGSYTPAFTNICPSNASKFAWN